ncbi:valine--tRNA ligase [Candidatus Aerophobetes bacterium]|uniref:Valine--tRNA ligase n=1 Tax=Aerophobetes bacterium TaxID=2030807 RepID=A0A2A4X6X4_UNCAE|nr:MAG: valine--tRNA ligase [Candidatus Aerophobetes bacterium]
MKSQEEPLPKQYNPHLTENKWYDFSLKNGFFHADPLSDKPPFCIMLPPPNVTGVLHMGHALINTLQDIMARYKRMMGFEVLWMPGVDHAGIATQTVVEKHLIATTGKKRKDFSREEFVKHIWKWKEQHEEEILNQLKKIGSSCDWMRHCFTMDETSTEAVNFVFDKMVKENLIYQGKYLVNWDVITQTALADDEVEHEERDSFLWHFSYPIDGTDDHLVIATTRPETLLGDTAVAVHPEDERYQNLKGKTVTIPIVNRQVPIIFDNFVDPSFGTGVVKITPAHDPNDYEVGLRLSLPMINIMNPDGTLNEEGLEYEGLSMSKARELIADRMDKMGCLVKKEQYSHRVGVSYRSKAVIEPYLSTQWFINMAPFKEKLIRAVKEERVKIIPKNFEATYFHWIDNLRDWCISRQLWWGHRIPIWRHKEQKEKFYSSPDGKVPKEIKDTVDEYEQETDVLDTWFSSALWPFSTLGFPHKTAELKRFYPNSSLMTGHDILFFWVARMIMMGEYVMGEVPFKEVNLQGLIFGKSYFKENSDGGITYVTKKERANIEKSNSVPKGVFSKWEKMSKSKGNVMDPLEIIDAYGADAMRMAITASATASMHIDLDKRRFEEFKNFANKMWNASRFILMNLTLDAEDLQSPLDHSLFTLDDKWMLSRCSVVCEELKVLIEGYKFDQVAKLGYTFFWDELCAYYLEFAKPILFQKQGSKKQFRQKQILLLFFLIQSITALHPLAPFITDEIFFRLKSVLPIPSNHEIIQDPHIARIVTALKQVACQKVTYPGKVTDSDIDKDAEGEFAFLIRIITQLRNIRGEMGLPPSAPSELYISGGEKNIQFIKNHQELIGALIRLEKIYFDLYPSSSEFVCEAKVDDITLVLPMPKAFREKEKQRLVKEQDKLEALIFSLKTKLSNKNFTGKAPKELVEKTKLNLKEAEQNLDHVKDKLSN